MRLRRVRQPIDSASASYGGAIKREANPNGPLFGEAIVFAGALEIPRRDAAGLAAPAGYEAARSVAKKTTQLVVGDKDVKRLAGHVKISKHRKAEELKAEGFPIRIIRETDFRELAAMGSALKWPPARRPNRKLVLRERIELSASPLPRECSTTELPQPSPERVLIVRRAGVCRIGPVPRQGSGLKSVGARLSRQDVPNVYRFNEHNEHALRVWACPLAKAPL